MDTRARIMEAAIALFNEQGTATVSTNHIAQAAAISPGNLYYHFRNKEQIIRAIFAQLILVWRGASALPADRPPQLADLFHVVRANFAVVWHYRFYYRELPALMRRDPALAAQYQALREEALVDVQRVLQRCAEAGILWIPAEPGILQELAQISWILADFWLPFVELGGTAPGPEQTRQGEQRILRILRPYLTDKALAELGEPEEVSATVAPAPRTSNPPKPPVPSLENPSRRESRPRPRIPPGGTDHGRHDEHDNSD